MNLVEEFQKAINKLTKIRDYTESAFTNTLSELKKLFPEITQTELNIFNYPQIIRKKIKRYHIPNSDSYKENIVSPEYIPTDTRYVDYFSKDNIATSRYGEYTGYKYKEDYHIVTGIYDAVNPLTSVFIPVYPIGSTTRPITGYMLLSCVTTIQIGRVDFYDKKAVKLIRFKNNYKPDFSADQANRGVFLVVGHNDNEDSIYFEYRLYKDGSSVKTYHMEYKKSTNELIVNEIRTQFDVGEVIMTRYINIGNQQFTLILYKDKIKAFHVKNSGYTIFKSSISETESMIKSIEFSSILTTESESVYQDKAVGIEQVMLKYDEVIFLVKFQHGNKVLYKKINISGTSNPPSMSLEAFDPDTVENLFRQDRKFEVLSSKHVGTIDICPYDLSESEIYPQYRRNFGFGAKHIWYSGDLENYKYPPYTKKLYKQIKTKKPTKNPLISHSGDVYSRYVRIVINYVALDSLYSFLLTLSTTRIYFDYKKYLANENVCGYIISNANSDNDYKKLELRTSIVNIVSLENVGFVMYIANPRLKDSYYLSGIVENPYYCNLKINVKPGRWAAPFHFYKSKIQDVYLLNRNGSIKTLYQNPTIGDMDKLKGFKYSLPPVQGLRLDFISMRKSTELDPIVEEIRANKFFFNNDIKIKKIVYLGDYNTIDKDRYILYHDKNSVCEKIARLYKEGNKVYLTEIPDIHQMVYGILGDYRNTYNWELTDMCLTNDKRHLIVVGNRGIDTTKAIAEAQSFSQSKPEFFTNNSNYPYLKPTHTEFIDSLKDSSYSTNSYILSPLIFLINLDTNKVDVGWSCIDAMSPILYNYKFESVIVTPSGKILIGGIKNCPYKNNFAYLLDENHVGVKSIPSRFLLDCDTFASGQSPVILNKSTITLSKFDKVYKHGIAVPAMTSATLANIRKTAYSVNKLELGYVKDDDSNNQKTVVIGYFEDITAMKKKAQVVYNDTDDIFMAPYLGTYTIVEGNVLPSFNKIEVNTNSSDNHKLLAHSGFEETTNINEIVNSEVIACLPRFKDGANNYDGMALCTNCVANKFMSDNELSTNITKNEKVFRNIMYLKSYNRNGFINSDNAANDHFEDDIVMPLELRSTPGTDIVYFTYIAQSNQVKLAVIRMNSDNTIGNVKKYVLNNVKFDNIYTPTHNITEYSRILPYRELFKIDFPSDANTSPNVPFEAYITGETKIIYSKINEEMVSIYHHSENNRLKLTEAENAPINMDSDNTYHKLKKFLFNDMSTKYNINRMFHKDKAICVRVVNLRHYGPDIPGSWCNRINEN